MSVQRFIVIAEWDSPYCISSLPGEPHVDFAGKCVVLADDHDREIERLRAALRAARACVFNSRHASWEEALRLVDAALESQQSETTREQK